jgi:hypothetical protein
MAHLAHVLEDPKANASRKDKAARLILTHTAGPRPRRAPAAAAAPAGKKQSQLDQAAKVASKPSKWAGLL